MATRQAVEGFARSNLMLALGIGGQCRGRNGDGQGKEGLNKISGTGIHYIAEKGALL